MNELDYIIVGSGLAGLAFSRLLEQHHKSFVVFDDNSQQSSKVAAGIYNPVMLKRFNLAWRAEAQIVLLEEFYGDLQRDLDLKIDHKDHVFRLINSVAEQNNWFTARDDSRLGRFMSDSLTNLEESTFDSPYGLGEVLESGRVDTSKLVEAYRTYLQNSGNLISSSFEYKDLEVQKNSMRYRDMATKKLVFAEGFGLKHNPYFNWLPLNGTKGELITIHAPELKLDIILKSGVFIVPIGDDQYRVGATYNRQDKTDVPTAAGKMELKEKLEKVLKCDYEILDHVSGIRPTVSDRRPLLGRHPEHDNIFVLNGFGSRGVLIAPYAANQLYNFIEAGQSLDPEMDISRFQ